ncbi:hypothetical protein GQ600_14238 [Phytophthora cactorum]|nr:hypothetical protein GQ600_14238 [Phytophthora cactorum]
MGQVKYQGREGLGDLSREDWENCIPPARITIGVLGRIDAGTHDPTGGTGTTDRTGPSARTKSAATRVASARKQLEEKPSVAVATPRQ